MKKLFMIACIPAFACFCAPSAHAHGLPPHIFADMISIEQEIEEAQQALEDAAWRIDRQRPRLQILRLPAAQ